MSTATDNVDVVVVGGGPAGSCTAGLLALQGRKVMLLERDTFPRYHIGESLITGVWPTLDALGLRDRLAARRFVPKYGAHIRWGKDEEFWGFNFRQAGPYEHVYQVRRAEFDALLLDRARELGVHVIENAGVKEPIFTDGRLTGLTYELRGEGAPRTATARMIVDASGQRRWLGTHLGLVEWFEDLRNVAVWSYWKGCLRYEGDRAGHTIIEMRRGGWLWFIPLGNDMTSIGYVSAISLHDGESIESVFQEQLDTSHEIKDMMRDAHRVDTYRTARDWSYRCSSFHGPGWVLVGDAAGFVDPLLSTGVALAVRGARFAARAVGHTLDWPELETVAMEAYADNHGRFLSTIVDYVRFFYDQMRSRTEYYAAAQEMIDPDREHAADFDFVKLVSGLAGDDEDIDLSMLTIVQSA